MLYKREIIQKLEKDGHWLVREITGTNRIACQRNVNKRTVTFYLAKTASDKLRLEFPTYQYVCRTSYLTSKEPEYRHCRDLRVLLPILSFLIETGVYPLLENPEFLKINDENKKSDKKLIQVRMKELMHDKMAKYNRISASEFYRIEE